MANQFLNPNMFRFERIIDPIFGAGQRNPPSPTYPSQATQVPDVAPPVSGEISQLNQNPNITSPTAELIRQLYQPEMGASTHLEELMSNMPQRRDPGMIRRILAGVAAFSGNPAMVENALYPGYHREMSDWKEALSPAIQAANFERASNINERQLASLIASQESQGLNRANLQAYRDELIRQADERIAQGDERVKLAEARAAEAVKQNEIRNKQTDQRIEIARAVARGGTPQRNPDTGKVYMTYRDGKVEELPALEGMTREEWAQIQQDFAIGRIQEGGAQTRQTQRERVGRVEAVEDPDNPGQRALAEVTVNEDGSRTTRFLTDEQGARLRPTSRVPTRTGQTPQSETQRIAGINQRARQGKIRPDWARYIVMKGTQLINIRHPNDFFGPTRQMYDDMYQYIFQTPAPDAGGTPTQGGTRSTQPATTVSQPQAATQPTTRAPQASTQPRQPTPSAGRIIVEKDGKRFSLPAEQRQQAELQGYRVVQ